MRLSFTASFILALSVAAKPLEERGGTTVVAATTVIAGGPVPSGAMQVLNQLPNIPDASLPVAKPTPASEGTDASATAVANPANTPQSPANPAPAPESVPQAGNDAAGLAAGLAAMAASLSTQAPFSTCSTTSSQDDDGVVHARYYFGGVSAALAPQFCADWSQAVKSNTKCPKALYAAKDWMTCSFKGAKAARDSASSTADALVNGYASIVIPKGLDAEQALECLGDWWKMSSCVTPVTQVTQTVAKIADSL